jgi:hypothetical protein
MTGSLPGGKLRAMAALVAAYALALQAVFTTLAPMQVQADGTLAVYCSGAAVDGSDTGAPVPASGKMQCVFCGACASGFAVLLPAASGVANLVARPLSLVRAAQDDRIVAIHVRDGPARAPPLSV